MFIASEAHEALNKTASRLQPRRADPSYSPWLEGMRLARIIHERFYCNDAVATATSLHTEFRGMQAGGLGAQLSTYYFKYASGHRASTRPSRHATSPFRDEPS